MIYFLSNSPKYKSNDFTFHHLNYNLIDLNPYYILNKLL